MNPDVHEPSRRAEELPAKMNAQPGSESVHSRRDFLKSLGGGIIIMVAFGDLMAADEGVRQLGRRTAPKDFNAFLRVGEDGRVTCLTGKIEMGQGPITSLPQMLAEELDVPLASVDIIMGDTDVCPFDEGTFGSLTTRAFGQLLRAAAAEARAVLLELAAEALKIPAERLVVEDGVILDRQNRGRRVTYGQVTKGKRIERRLSGKPKLKDSASFRVIGKPLLRRDAREKVTGAANYTADIRLRGMLYAKILRAPAEGAQLKSLDTSACEQVAGVRVVRDGELVAVLHELPDVAESALGKIKAEYGPAPSNLDDKTIFDHLVKVTPPAKAADQAGNLAEGEKLAAKTFNATYLNGYVAHAAIEPHAAVAEIVDGKATVWASTQTPYPVQDLVAKALELPGERVRVIVPLIGGGFGGKNGGDQAIEAARLAKACGKPVHVSWTREEEFIKDTFRPATVTKVRSGMDADGKVVLWDFDIYFAGARGAEIIYSVPHRRILSRGGFSGAPGKMQPFATGAWRGPGNHTNTFARESQMDIMAAAAGVDPIEFRLKNLTNARMIHVLKTAAEKFGWTPMKGPSQRGWGVACGIDAGTYVTLIAEVAVDARTGKVRVKRVVCVQDMGLVVNPEGARMQMEGCITMGLGYSLTEEVHFKNGELLDTNFYTYDIPRFSWLPKIETHFIEANNKPPQGGGEPAIIVMGAAIANAIFDATGARVYQMPMTPERVKEAMARKS